MSWFLSHQLIYCSPNGEKMTIRRMLELNDFLLRHYGFADPWLDQKVQENHASIAVFQTRLEELDALEHEAKWVELVKGLLAGNFDRVPICMDTRERVIFMFTNDKKVFTVCRRST